VKEYDIPLLNEKDIDVRVQSVSKSKNNTVGAIIVLYKDARVDMTYLDKVFGPGNWQRTHEVINGNLFCNIDIWDEDKKEWIRKQDVGSENTLEKEKGPASDAFKRAGFNVGIGRELYSAPFIYIPLKDNEFYVVGQGDRQSYKCYERNPFKVSEIKYNDRREISSLIIVDRNGNVRYKMNSYTPPARPETPAPTAPPTYEAPQAATAPQERYSEPVGQRYSGAAQSAPMPTANGSAAASKCPVCGGPISAAEQNYSKKKFGREMCRACQKNA
jgi:hypothetical protein